MSNDLKQMSSIADFLPGGSQYQEPVTPVIEGAPIAIEVSGVGHNEIFENVDPNNINIEVSGDVKPEATLPESPEDMVEMNDSYIIQQEMQQMNELREQDMASFAEKIDKKTSEEYANAERVKQMAAERDASRAENAKPVENKAPAVNEGEAVPSMMNYTTNSETPYTPVETPSDTNDSNNSDPDSEVEDAGDVDSDIVPELMVKNKPVNEFNFSNMLKLTYVPDQTVKNTIVVEGKPIEFSSTQRTAALSREDFAAKIANVKLQSKRKTLAILGNSGFIATTVGAGISDFLRIFSPEIRKNALAYEILKSELVFQAICDTHPKINPVDVTRALHYADFDVLLHAYVCGTQKEVKTPATCEHCGTDFLITSDPSDLYIEVDTPMEQFKIINAKDPKEPIISKTNLTHEYIDEETNIKITIQEPNHKRYLSSLRYIRDEQLTDTERNRLYQLHSVLVRIPKIQFPDGDIIEDMLQIDLATQLLGEASYKALLTIIQKNQEDLIFYKYGISKPKCPKCHKENEDIIFGSMEELVFYHIQVQLYLDQEEANSKNN